MMHRFFSLSVISRVIGIFILTGIFAYCQSDNVPKQTDTTAAMQQSVKAPGGKTTVEKEKERSSDKERKLIVYYFHTNFRCRSCTMIENLTKQAVNTGFTDQLKTGRIEIKVINIEEPENEHYVQDYKLYTKSVILSDRTDGKEQNWKNLDKVWTLLGDENKFIDYIQTEVKAQL